MIINMDRLEIATLTLHMSIMRKNVRKGFKSNYQSEAKNVLNSYDEVKNSMAAALEEIETNEKQDPYEFNFNIKEVEMMCSFLGFYTKELQQTLGKVNVSQEDKIQIDCLNGIKNKVDELKAM